MSVALRHLTNDSTISLVSKNTGVRCPTYVTICKNEQLTPTKVFDIQSMLATIVDHMLIRQKSTVADSTPAASTEIIK